MALGLAPSNPARSGGSGNKFVGNVVIQVTAFHVADARKPNPAEDYVEGVLMHNAGPLVAEFDPETGMPTTIVKARLSVLDKANDKRPEIAHYMVGNVNRVKAITPGEGQIVFEDAILASDGAIESRWVADYTRGNIDADKKQLVTAFPTLIENHTDKSDHSKIYGQNAVVFLGSENPQPANEAEFWAQIEASLAHDPQGMLGDPGVVVRVIDTSDGDAATFRLSNYTKKNEETGKYEYRAPADIVADYKARGGDVLNVILKNFSDPEIGNYIEVMPTMKIETGLDSMPKANVWDQYKNDPSTLLRCGKNDNSFYSKYRESREDGSVVTRHDGVRTMTTKILFRENGTPFRTGSYPANDGKMFRPAEIITARLMQEQPEIAAKFDKKASDRWENGVMAAVRSKSRDNAPEQQAPAEAGGPRP